MLELNLSHYWPEQVSVDVEIGTDAYTSTEGPCCAVGHAGYEFKIDRDFACSSKLYEWRMVYKELYRAIYNPDAGNHEVVETINDDKLSSDKERKDLYLLTWAKLGYVNGMPKHILKMLKSARVKKVQIKWRKA